MDEDNGKYTDISNALADIETELRIKSLPSLAVRPSPLEADDLMDKSFCRSNNAAGGPEEEEESVLTTTTEDDGDGSSYLAASLRRRNLREFSLSMIIKDPSTIMVLQPSFERITSLDVSNNELMDLPGLGTMVNVRSLNLCRNWFNTLPLEIGSLAKLATIDASRNFLRPNGRSLLFDDLKPLSRLRSLNLSYNQKCGRHSHRETITNELPQLTECKITIWDEVGAVPGSYVGKSPAERDESLLRSRLEPWGTVDLRRRLVQDFGELPSDPSVMDRAGVMHRLLKRYEQEGWMDANTGVDQRTTIRVEGVPVHPDRIDELLKALWSWLGEDREDRRSKKNKKRERPSIRAQSYMILRSPDAVFRQTTTNNSNNNNGDNASACETTATGPKKTGRSAIRTAKKLEKHRKLWDLAQEAIRGVDPVFAERYTELAVTYGFRGSPHIDKQNSGPFYGLSLGDFREGDGGICVECSARVLAHVNTRNRLGRVDGRYPHWVAPYDNDSERFSLIYYETGKQFIQPKNPIFSLPPAPTTTTQ